MNMIDNFKKEMKLFDEAIYLHEFNYANRKQENYKKLITETMYKTQGYLDFIKANKSFYFSLYNPNFDFEDYFVLYSLFEGYEVKESHIDWSDDEGLMILGCIGQETYLFCYGKEVYAFPQIMEYEPENLIEIAEDLEELLTNKEVFDKAMKYSDLIQQFFEDDEEYEAFLNN